MGRKEEYKALNFLNISPPKSGIYNLGRKYEEYFRLRGFETKWVNFRWDSNIDFDEEITKHFIGSGFTINLLKNTFIRDYKIEGMKIYTDHRLMPTLDGKEIVIIHDFFRDKKFVTRWKKRRVLSVLRKNKVRVITNSLHTKEMAKKKGLNVVSELYPYYDLGVPKFSKEEKLIISVGSNDPRKRPDLIADFVNNLGNQWKFIRVGDNLNDIKKISTKAEYIHVKRISDSELHSIYDRASYLFLPSEDEGLGLPMIEALFHNVTVIANEKNPVLKEFDFPDIISAEKEGNFYIPSYPDALEFLRFRKWYISKIEYQFNTINSTFTE
jgi:glycosyltransferase involved in cell wall biosynthesis